MTEDYHRRKRRRTPKKEDSGKNASLLNFINSEDHVDEEKGDKSIKLESTSEQVICPECGKSDEIIERGVRKTKFRGGVQRYGCKRCHCRFVNEPFSHTWFPDWVYERVLEDAVTGLKNSQIAKNVNDEAKRRNENIKISSKSVLKIKEKTAGILLELELRARPTEKAAIWQIDDTPQPYSKKKEKGEKVTIEKTDSKKEGCSFAWITNILEEDDRYCLAQVTSEDRKAANSEKATRLALLRAKYGPQLVKCDGYKGHIKGVRAALKHIEIDSRTKKEDYAHINRIERYHQTMRSLGLPKRRHFRSIHALNVTAELVRLYYNFIRPHKGLGGTTPAKKAGVDYPYHDGLTWLELIRFAFVFIRRKSST
jgi:transposase InsO family protein